MGIFEGNLLTGLETLEVEEVGQNSGLMSEMQKLFENTDYQEPASL